MVSPYLDMIPFTGISEECRRDMLRRAHWLMANGPARMQRLRDRLHPCRWIESTSVEREIITDEYEVLRSLAPTESAAELLVIAWESKDDDPE